MRRRRFALGLAALAAGAAMPVRGQRTIRLATLDEASAEARQRVWAAFHGRMRELGHVEGAGYAVERRYADGDRARLQRFANELAALKPDVIVTAGTPTALAAKRATSSIPIVFGGVADPVGTGLIASLARPGGNLTGVTNIGTDIAGKWLGLIRELAPGVKSVAFLTDTRNAGSMRIFDQLKARAQTAGIEVRAFDGTSRDDVARSFRAIEGERIGGLIMSQAANLFAQQKQIVELAARLRMPAIYAPPIFCEGGGLMSFSADIVPLWRRCAELVDRVLRGASPAEMPVEQAAVFQMTVNLKTARALGIAIPQSLLIRADRVIE